MQERSGRLFRRDRALHRRGRAGRASFEQYFSEFDEHPFAAVPIGQVHRAQLRQEGVWVARESAAAGPAELFERDLVLIRWFARLVAVLRIRRHMRWEEGLADLVQQMKEDLDFHFEAASMRRMRRQLRTHDIFVPRVYSRYCGRRVLVSEFIQAVLMSDYIRVRDTAPVGSATGWLRTTSIPGGVARLLLGSMFRQILEDNLYHADMRPGNIVLLRNSRVAFIDFRTVYFTERGIS